MRYIEKIKQIVNARHAARRALNPNFLTPGTALYVATCEEYLQEALAIIDIIEAMYGDSAARTKHIGYDQISSTVGNHR